MFCKIEVVLRTQQVLFVRTVCRKFVHSIAIGLTRGAFAFWAHGSFDEPRSPDALRFPRRSGHGSFTDPRSPDALRFPRRSGHGSLVNRARPQPCAFRFVRVTVLLVNRARPQQSREHGLYHKTRARSSPLFTPLGASQRAIGRFFHIYWFTPARRSARRRLPRSSRPCSRGARRASWPAPDTSARASAPRGSPRCPSR